MKILFLSPNNFFDVQGSTEPYYVYNYLCENYQVELLTRKDKNASKNKGQFYSVPNLPLIPFLLTFNLMALWLILRPKKEDIDLIYCYKGVFLPVKVLRSLFDFAWIYDLRTAPVEQDRKFRKDQRKTWNWFESFKLDIEETLYKNILTKQDLILTLSEDLQKMLEAKYHLPSAKIHLLPLGVDLELFSPEKRVREDKLAPDLVKMVCVTSINKTRVMGLKVILDAMALLKGEEIHCKLTIVGRSSKDMIEGLKQYARERHLEEDLHLKGYVPHDEIPSLLEKYDIGLSPLPDIEAYRVASPTKVFEYLAMKKIVIASDITSHRKIIKDKYNGLLYNPNDPAAFTNTLVNLSRNPQLAKDLKSNSRTSIKDKSWNKILRELDQRLKLLFKD